MTTTRIEKKAPTKWRPPPPSCVKFNIDASCDTATGKGFASIIGRDDHGYLLSASMCQIFGVSPLMAEALGLREVVFLASSLSIPKVIFESDNQILIEICRGNTKRGEIQSIINDIEIIKMGFEYCGFTWTRQDGNKVAHTILELASKGNLVGDWPQNPPEALRSSLVIDMHGLWS